MQYLKLHNPLKEDFEFKWDSQAFIVKAGETRELDPYIAKHGAKHLCDYIILRPELWEELGLKRESRSLDSERDEIYHILFSGSMEEAPKEEPKDEVPPLEQPKKEDEFEDLDEQVSEVEV